MSKISLYAAVIFMLMIVSILECDAMPSINDISQVGLDSEPLETVYSLRYYYGDNYIEYVVGHSSFKVSFDDIYKLEIYKKSADKYYMDITDTNMNKIENREVKQISVFTGTVEDSGIKGEFTAYLNAYDKVVITGIEENAERNAQNITNMALIHVMPPPPSDNQEVKEPVCENGICTKSSALTPTYLSLMITSNDPFASKEEIPADNINLAKNWLYQGNANYTKGSYEKALNCYEKAIEFATKSPTLWYYKGDALYQLQMYKDAVKAYKQATDLAPNFTEAWNNLALSYRNLGLKEESLDAFTKSKELSISSAVVAS